MKHLKLLHSLLAMLLMLTCSVALTSCSDDDDDDGGGSIARDKLVGNWVLPYDYDSAEIYSLQSNGTCYYYEYELGTDYAYSLSTWRWSFDSSTNTIIIWDDYEEESYEVISVTSTTLKWRDLVFGGGTQTLTKISDSELPTDIEQY